jgi:hypothetical protein
MEDKIKNIKEIISKLENKEFSLYFFTLDTKGNPTAGISNIYEQVKILTELGYNAHILHEKDDYKLNGDENGSGLTDWLGLEYGKLSHVSIESKKLNVRPEDFIIIPEIFSNVMNQVKDFPCKKVVLAQSYSYALELLPMGTSWTSYGFNDVITTSNRQAEHLVSLFPGMNTHIIPVSISDQFKDSEMPKLPVVAIHTRDSADAGKIIKMFYLKNPMFKWISFKELKGLRKEVFAEELRTSCLSVWVDDVAGFGTFPLESIKSNTPVIGKIPEMTPEWMETEKDGSLYINNNGLWTSSLLEIPDLISTYLQLWLNDNFPQEISDSMAETSKLYTTEEQAVKVNEVFTTLVNNRISDFNNLLDEVNKTEKA